MKPMNNAMQVFKTNEFETLKGMQEEWAKVLCLARHKLLIKTGPQLKELSERKPQRTFDEVNPAALAAQRKTEEDFSRVRKLVVQMQKSSSLRRIKYMSHGLNKHESKVTSSDKSKVLKFKREPNQSKPLQETQKGR